MKRAEFLKETIATCKANLQKPNTRYPNGRMSHDVEAEHLLKCEEELEDLRLEGFYDAYGRFVSYKDGTSA